MEWIEELINNLPKEEERRRNFIEIAGYPKWENVNSNLLAFYFDKNEQHGFESLFFDSLLELIKEKYNDLYNQEWEKNDSIATDFLVEREVLTDSAKRIDILLTEDINNTDSLETEDEDVNENIPGWAIIIENKINAPLNNDLLEYWNSINAEYKIGVILSRYELNYSPDFNEGELIYLNILHHELIEKVINNLSSSFLNADDRHLLLLKEFILNINSLYVNPSYQKNMNEILEQFRSKAKEIRELKSNDKKLLKYISDSLFPVMEKNGFPPASSKNSSNTKFFLFDENSEVIKDEHKDVAKNFRFWFNIGNIRYFNEAPIFFELYRKSSTIHGEILKDRLKKEGMFTDNIIQGPSGKVGGNFYHIYQLKLDLSINNHQTFEEQFRKEIESKFFNSPENHLSRTVEILYDIINNKKD